MCHTFLQLLKVTTRERFLRYKVKDMQLTSSVRLPACSIVAGKAITGVLIVMDVWSLVRCFEVCCCLVDFALTTFLVGDHQFRMRTGFEEFIHGGILSSP